MAKSNWNKLTTWYSGMAGSAGHKHHQFIMPHLLSKLKLTDKDKVLDIGCGTGILYENIKKFRPMYFGLDSSRHMIEIAKKNNPRVNFILTDASKFTKSPDLRNQKFTKVVFLLSIQDMDPLADILSEVSQVTDHGAEVLIAMLHPAFRIPRQSGWGNDDERKIIYRRVDRYLSLKTIPLDTKIIEKGKPVKSYFYHRPLEAYINLLSRHNFYITSADEIPGIEKEHLEFPLFLILHAKKFMNS